MACPHGHPSRPEEYYGGECHTCLERPAGDICGCDYCVRGLHERLNLPFSTKDFPYQPERFIVHVKNALGTSLVTKENYAQALALLRHYCDCEHPHDANHPEAECETEGCSLCGILTCGDPLYYRVRQLQGILDRPYERSYRQPARYLDFVKKQLGGVITKANFDEADFLLGRMCDCVHFADPNHSEDECYKEECVVCGLLKCGEPLHYHHDECPKCWDTELFFDDYEQKEGPVPDLEDI